MSASATRGEATTRFVYAGKECAGDISHRDGSWRATSRDGRTIGFYATDREAIRAVLDHHRNSRDRA